MIDATVCVNPVRIDGEARELGDRDWLISFQPVPPHKDLVKIITSDGHEFVFNRHEIETALQICALAVK